MLISGVRAPKLWCSFKACTQIFQKLFASNDDSLSNEHHNRVYQAREQSNVTAAREASQFC